MINNRIELDAAETRHQNNASEIIQQYLALRDMINSTRLIVFFIVAVLLIGYCCARMIEDGREKELWQIFRDELV